MQTKTEIKLTSAEIGTLWTTYLSDSMASCFLKYFLEKVKDTDIRPVVEYALSLSQKHIQDISEIYKNEGHAAPIGFTDEDVDTTVPPLYSDNFYLFYLHNMSRLGLSCYSVAMSAMARQDIFHFYRNCLETTIELSSKVTTTLLSKGLLVRAPYITIPDKVDFVKKQSFLTGFLGERRSLLALEIGDLFINIQSSIFYKTLLTGFAQVADSEQVRDLMIKGKRLTNNLIEGFSSKLDEEDIPASKSWDAVVTDSQEAPFSDKLMVFHIAILNSGGLGNFGTALSTSLRHDLQAEYVLRSTEIGQYGATCLNFMIDKGWLEQPPQAINNKTLAKV